MVASKQWAEDWAWFLDGRKTATWRDLFTAEAVTRGVTVSNISIGLVAEIGVGLLIQVQDNLQSPCQHWFGSLGTYASDWSTFTDVLAEALTSYTAFGDAFEDAYPDVASYILTNWSSTKRLALWAVAAAWADELGL